PRALLDLHSFPTRRSSDLTFEVRSGRKVLTLVDDPSDADFWKPALDYPKDFQCEVRRVAELGDLSPTDLSQRYQAICLLNVAQPDRKSTRLNSSHSQISYA